ncbi:hypothetical protein D910_09623 [Dendroctonus ponderosae]
MEPITESARKESCLSCKLISIGCLTGIGSYLVATSIRSYKGKSRAFIGALGAGAICLGAGEIFDKSPFRSSGAV